MRASGAVFIGGRASRALGKTMVSDPWKSMVSDHWEWVSPGGVFRSFTGLFAAQPARGGGVGAWLTPVGIEGGV